MDGVDLRRSSPIFKIVTLSRVENVFGGSFVKCHTSGDISIICLWLVVKNDVADLEYLKKAAYVIPMNEIDDKTIRCFLPCGGIDPTTDEVPSWSEEIMLNEIIPGYDVKDLYSLRKRGTGKMTTCRHTDFTSIVSGQVKEGDFIVCRGQWLEVGTFADDAFYPEGYRDSIRFKSDVKQNINKQNFDIIRWPSLQGNIVVLEKNNLILDEPVSILLNKINLENIGILKANCLCQKMFKIQVEGKI